MLKFSFPQITVAQKNCSCFGWLKSVAKNREHELMRREFLYVSVSARWPGPWSLSGFAVRRFLRGIFVGT